MTSFIEILNHWGDHFLNFAWPMLWQSSLLIAIIFALDVALRRKIRAAIRYALWLMVLVKLLLPPSLALQTSLAWWLMPSPQPPAMPQKTSYVVTYGEQTAPTLPPQFQPAPAPIQPRMSAAAWALTASVAVSAGLLAWLLVRWLQINQKVRRANVSTELIPLLDEARRLTHLRPGIRLKLTEDSMSPAVCGLFRPVILLPQSLVERLSAGQLRAVLLHEAIHLRRGDVWVNCAQALLQIFYWWHPLLWLANARIRRVREEAVDDAVMLALHDDAEIYAPTLLEVAKLAFNRPLASLGLVGILESRSALRQRIERLINFRAPRKAGLTLVSILSILAFTAIALPMGEAPEQTNALTASASNLTDAASASDINTNAVTGILLDINFQARVHALEQRTRVETLAEPKRVVTSGGGADYINANHIQQVGYTHAAEGVASSTGLMTFFIRPPINENHLKNLLLDAGVNTPPTVFVYMDDGILLARGSKEQLDRVYRVVLKLNGYSPKVDIRLPVTNSPVTNTDIHTSSGREMIYRKLNSLRLEYVSWSNGLPLSEVLRYLAEQSKLRDPDKKGINFIYNPSEAASTTSELPEKPTAGAAPDAVDASTINVKLMLNNASLHDVLDVMVQGADRPIKYSVEDYAVVISPKPSGPEPPTLEMRVFKVDPRIFASGLRSIPGLQTNNVSTMVESLFSKLGVDLTATGRSIAFQDRLGLLFVKATPPELDTVERVIQALNQVPLQIHIKARFIEVPKGSFEFPTRLTNSVGSQVTGILTDPNFRTVIHALEKRDGVETLAEPEAVTTSGRQTQMRATNLRTVLTGINPLALKPPGVSSNELFQTDNVECGPVLDEVPYVLSDGYTVYLTTTASTIDFLGYAEPTNSVTAYIDGQKQTVPVPLPRFRIRKISTRVNLFDSQTLVLGKPDEQFTGPAGKSDDDTKELLVFVTATVVDPAGNRVHSDDELPFNPSTIPPQPKFSNPSP